MKLLIELIQHERNKAFFCIPWWRLSSWDKNSINFSTSTNDTHRLDDDDSVQAQKVWLLSCAFIPPQQTCVEEQKNYEKLCLAFYLKCKFSLSSLSTLYEYSWTCSFCSFKLLNHSLFSFWWLNILKLDSFNVTEWKVSLLVRRKLRTCIWV